MDGPVRLCSFLLHFQDAKAISAADLTTTTGSLLAHGAHLPGSGKLTVLSLGDDSQERTRHADRAVNICAMSGTMRQGHGNRLFHVIN